MYTSGTTNYIANSGTISAIAKASGANTSAVAYGVYLSATGSGTNILDNSGLITASASGDSTAGDAVYATGTTEFANEETGVIHGNVIMDNSANMAQLFAGSQITGNLLIVDQYQLRAYPGWQ